MSVNDLLDAALRHLAEINRRNAENTKSANAQFERMCTTYKEADNGQTRHTVLEELNRDVCIAKTRVETVANNNKIALDAALKNVAFAQNLLIQESIKS